MRVYRKENTVGAEAVVVVVVVPLLRDREKKAQKKRGRQTHLHKNSDERRGEKSRAAEKRTGLDEAALAAHPWGGERERRDSKPEG